MRGLLAFFAFFSYFLATAQTDSLQQQISRDEFVKGINHSIGGAISGKIPFLLTSRPGSNPSRGFDMMYQGFSSFRGRNQPWLFIDDMLLFEETMLDPYIVSSVALPARGERASYGILGGPGVFELKGTAYGEQGLSINFGQELALENFTRSYDVLTADQYLSAIAGTSLENEFSANDGNTHWIEEVTQPGFSHITFGDIRYSSSNFKIASGISHRNIASIQPGAGFDQFSNFTKAQYSTPVELVTVKGAVHYTHRDAQYGSGQFFHGAIGMNPTFGPDQPLGDFFSLYDGNPKLNLEHFSDRDKKKSLSYTGEIILRPAAGLKIGSRFNATNYTHESRLDNSINDQRIEKFEHNRNWYSSKTYLAYDWRVSKKMSVKPLVYYQFQHVDHSESNRLEIGVNPASLRADSSDGKFGTTAVGYSLTASGNHWEISTSGKIEDASNFGANASSAFFYGVHGQYRPLDWLNFDLSYVSTGNYPLTSGVSRDRLTKIYNGPGIADFQLERISNGNPDLKWEEIKTLELGAEVALTRKWALGARYFRSSSADLIDSRRNMDPPIGPDPVLLRTTPTPFNFGEIINQGLSFELTARKVSIGRLDYDTYSNFNIQNSKWTDLSYGGGSLNNLLLRQSSRYEFFAQYQMRENQSPSAMYLPRFLGADPEGDWLLDYGGPQNRPETFPQAGDALPNMYFASTHRLSLNGWRLEFMIDGAFGHSIYNYSRALYQQNIPTVSNYLASYRDLQSLGLTSYGPASDYYLENAGFLRVNYLAAGRKFLLSKPKFIKCFDLQLSVNNLATITNYEGADPSVRLQSDREENYPYYKPGADFEDSWLPSRIYSLRLVVGY